MAVAIVCCLTLGDTGALAAEPIAKLNSHVSIKPQRSGTDVAPRPAVIEGRLGWEQTFDEHRRPTHLKIFLSRRLAYSGRGRPTCAAPATYKEAQECPDRSVIGSVRAGGEPVFNAFCSSHVLLINGGPGKVYVAGTGGCVAFDEVKVGTILKLRHRRWGYRLTFPMPSVFAYSTSSGNGAFLYYGLGEKPPASYGPFSGDDPPIPSGYWRTTGCSTSDRHAVRVEIPHSRPSDADGVSATRAVSRCRAAVSPARAAPW